MIHKANPVTGPKVEQRITVRLRQDSREVLRPGEHVDPYVLIYGGIGAAIGQCVDE